MRRPAPDADVGKEESAGQRLGCLLLGAEANRRRCDQQLVKIGSTEGASSGNAHRENHFIQNPALDGTNSCDTSSTPKGDPKFVLDVNRHSIGIAEFFGNLKSDRAVRNLA